LNTLKISIAKPIPQMSKVGPEFPDPAGMKLSTNPATNSEKVAAVSLFLGLLLRLSRRL